jgi:hypothetical protein
LANFKIKKLKFFQAIKPKEEAKATATFFFLFIIGSFRHTSSHRFGPSSTTFVQPKMLGDTVTTISSKMHSTIKADRQKIRSKGEGNL